MQHNDPRKRMSEEFRLSQVAKLEKEIQRKRDSLSNVKLSLQGYEAFAEELKILEIKLKSLRSPLL